MENKKKQIKNREKILFEITEQFLRVVNKFSRLHSEPRDYGDGNMLYPSEIHTLGCIGRNPRVGVTELAEKMGVTKSAISQMISKLIKKDLLIKAKAVNNDKNVFLILTENGEIVNKGHEEFHKELNKILLVKMKDVQDNKLMEYANTNKLVEGILNDMLEKFKN